jgi:hypothetical protein
VVAAGAIGLAWMLLRRSGTGVSGDV